METLKITFVGDVMCEPLMIKAAEQKSGYNFDFVFKNVQELFSESDYIVGNLETPLAGKLAGYTKELFSFNAPNEFADAVKKAGFSLVITSNNHCVDRGFAGLIHTIQVLDEKGINHLGTWIDKRPEAFYFEKNGQRIAVVTSCYGTNYGSNHYILTDEQETHINLLHSYKEPVYEKAPLKSALLKKIVNAPFKLLKAEQKVAVKKALGMTYNTPREDSYLNENTAAQYIDKFLADIASAKTKADVVIPFLHVGGQFNRNPGRFTQYVFEQAIKAGSNAVIASHPHIVQKAEIRNGVPCFYSLGNFSMSPNSNYLLHENLPEYGLAVHFYIREGQIKKITFSILKIIETCDQPLTVYPVDKLYSLCTDYEKETLISDMNFIYQSVMGRKINNKESLREFVAFEKVDEGNR